MLLDKFAKFVELLDTALSEMLPSDLVIWLGGLVVVIFVLAVWRMIH